MSVLPVPEWRFEPKTSGTRNSSANRSIAIFDYYMSNHKNSLIVVVVMVVDVEIKTKA
jgi:hypothetical protein